MARRSERWLAALALALFEGGCDSCKSDPPYTPFGVTSSLPNTPDPPESAATAAGSALAAEPRRQALIAPPNAKTWDVNGLSLEAPENYVFAQALGIDTSSGKEAVAWVKATPEVKAGSPYVLVAFRSDRPSRKLLELPSFVPQVPPCKVAIRLAQSGPSSVFAGARGSCETPLMERAPVESASIVGLGREQPELLTLRLAAAASGESLSVAADSNDRDGDGRDDVRLQVTLTAPGGGSASAELAYLDRAAGISRDASEPSASLLRDAKALLAKAGNAANAHATLERIDAARRLLATLCEEAATPRVFDAEGAGLRCGELLPVVDALARAETLSHLALKDPIGAVAVLTRADWYFRPLSSDARKAITRELSKKLLLVTPSVVTLATKPKLVAGAHFSPLWFEADGALLVQGESGLTRVARDGSSEMAIDVNAGSPVAWPLVASNDRGARLVGSLCACDSSALQLTLQSESGGPLPGQPTDILAPRPGGCRGRFTCPDPVPLGVGEAGFTVLLAGTVVAPGKAPSALPSPGSPRSPDGQWLVVESPLGLIVSGSASERWKLPEAAPDLRRSSACVVSNDRAAVACVADGKAVLLRRALATDPHQ